MSLLRSVETLFGLRAIQTSLHECKHRSTFSVIKTFLGYRDLTELIKIATGMSKAYNNIPTKRSQINIAESVEAERK